MLFLCVYKRPAGYIDGETMIGLISAEYETEAKRKFRKSIGVWGEDDQHPQDSLWF